mmetsp:Transcript_12120/g.18266  ORF Transcript_12120/g.18266 Transcript_12120/m.18266 type:complete len:149 (-) Transcript_12120:103-549(-)
MAPFPDEDREMYPEMFRLPDGVYEVALERPLGIAFEERDDGRGVVVDYLVEGGNAEASGVIQSGDILIATTAVKVIGAKWEVRLIPVLELGFDTIMSAIGSNEPKWLQPVNGKYLVYLQFQRPKDADPEEVKRHLEFFTPPSDSSWVR